MNRSGTIGGSRSLGRMRGLGLPRAATWPALAAVALLLAPLPGLAQRGGGGGGYTPALIEFSALLTPDAVTVGSNRTMILCLVNQGAAGTLLRDGFNDDHLDLTVPKGPDASDLEADGVTAGCTPPAGWACVPAIEAGAVVYTVGPAGASLPVPAGGTACFDLTGVQVNSVAGLSLNVVDQFIPAYRAYPLLNRLLPVLKTAGSAAIRHDDLADVRADQHHAKTTRFSELTDAATDAQIPDDITVNAAAACGNADTVDGRHASELTRARGALGLNYIIALQGVFPSSGGGPASEPYLGEVRLFAGNFAPGGWAVCDGQILPISSYTALFSILGTTYGGDGRTNFALPDLRGRVPIHEGTGPGGTNVRLGQRCGTPGCSE